MSAEKKVSIHISECRNSLDDALKATAFGKFNYGLILVCGLLFVCWFFEISGIGFYLPVAECDLNITSKQDYGLINGVAFAGLVSSFYLWGFLADTKGRKKVMIPSLLISFLFSIISALSTSFWIFTVARFFNGFFVAASASTTYAYLGEFHHSDVRRKVMIVTSCIYICFSMLLPVGAWAILEYSWSFQIPIIDVAFKPWRLCALFTSLPGILCTFCLMFLPESPKFMYSMGQEKETLKILSYIYSLNTAGQAYPVKKICDPELNSIETNAKDYFNKIWQQIKQLFSEYLRPTVVLCCLQLGACAYGVALMVFFPKILQAVAEYRLSQFATNDSKTICEIIAFSSTLSMTSNVTLSEWKPDCLEHLDFTAFTYPLMILGVCALFFLFSSFLVNYTGIVPMAVGLFALNFASSIGIIFSKIPTLSLFLFALVILSGGNNNLVGSATIEYYPTNLRSSAVSVSLIFGRSASVLGSYLLGYFFDHHCNTVFLLCAVTFIFCCFVATFLPKPKVQTTRL